MRSPQPVLSRTWPLAGAQLLALAGVYALALGTDSGIAFDSRAILDAHTTKPWSAHWTVSDAVHGVAAASFALMAVAIAVLRRGDVRRLAAAALLVGGASATAQLLKPALAGLGLLGATSVHELEGSFPSGHAATALALGLALVDAVPGGWRATAAAFAVLCSTAVAVGLLTLGWHYPSDVVGGFLIAGAWSAVTRRGPPPAVRAWSGAAVVGALALAAAGCLAVPYIAFAHLVEGRAVPPGFTAGVVIVAAVALLVTVGSSRR